MYTNKLSGLLPTGTVQSLTTAGPTDIYVLLAHNKVTLKQIAFKIKTAMTVTPAVISVYSRPGPSANGTQTLLGTLTIPLAATAAIGAVVYKNITPVSIPQGYELAFVCTTAATAGDGWCMAAEVEDCPQTEANVSTAQASA